MGQSLQPGHHPVVYALSLYVDLVSSQLLDQPFFIENKEGHVEE